ncbi:hypothetical protein J7L81_04570 [Candidatus Aerophobetes bacterium]|uniref:Uncharacterized protein n=1 Tax=Aerophobetes bacterium TaxID=2030807 RepID=A0A7V5HZY1_UNCAE|nr:hypothetical protein [Candidatus Aerophobetes bacterium]HHF99013.1 hypothetical protein [Candidatus Aerophobetes bacterium]
MPRGFRGRGWGPGYYGLGFWGRGNPFPFCRFFPWLPRWWWATPYAPYFASTILGPMYSPYSRQVMTSYPYYGW